LPGMLMPKVWKQSFTPEAATPDTERFQHCR
jgi:hypothetical protein